MSSFGKVIRGGYIQILKSIATPKYILAMVLQVAHAIYYVLKYYNYSNAIHEPVNIFEGYLCMTSSEYMGIIMMSIFLLAVSDVPFLKNNNLSELIRMEKGEWYLGKIVFMAFTALLQQLIAIGISVMVLASVAVARNLWSISFYQLVNGGALSSFALEYDGLAVMHMFTPVAAAVVQALLYIVVNVTLGAFMMNIALFKGRITAFIVVIILHLVGFIMFWRTFFNFFPLQNVVLTNVVEKGVMPTIIYSLTLAVFIIAVGTILAGRVELKDE